MFPLGGLWAGEGEPRPRPHVMISCISTQTPGSHRQELINQYAHFLKSHVFVFAFLMCVWWWYGQENQFCWCSLGNVKRLLLLDSAILAIWIGCQGKMDRNCSIRMKFGKRVVCFEDSQIHMEIRLFHTNLLHYGAKIQDNRKRERFE